MLMVLQNERILNRIEHFIHRCQHHVVPGRAQTQKLPKGAHVELEKCFNNINVNGRIRTAKMDRTRILLVLDIRLRP